MGENTIMKTAVLLLLSVVAAAYAAPVNNDPTPPHLAQAWTAESTGDGLKGKTGKESYIYEDCKTPSPTCLHAHIWDYGADTCIKYEINGGFHYPGTGQYYVKCDAVDCCKAANPDHQEPNPKKWDIEPSSWWASRKTTYSGKHDTTELNNETVTGADVWNSLMSVPLTHGKASINYTYHITKQGNDTISHRIDYSVPGIPKVPAGHILYGNFTPQHDLAAFRKVFMPPPACLKHNVLTCQGKQVKK